MLPHLRADEVEAYDRHFALLRDWNQRMNLVSRKSIETSFEYHYADCLHTVDFASQYIGNRQVVDVGSGAGFPGVIFAIRFPSQRIRLFEKIGKKRLFLAEAVTRLELKNVEMAPTLDGQGANVFMFARAVFPPDELFRFARRSLARGSRFVLNRAGEQAKRPTTPKGFLVLGEHHYELPLNAGKRSAFVIECST